MSGSTALLPASVAPDMVRSIHGDSSQSAPRQVLARAHEFSDQSKGQISACAVAADRNGSGRIAFAPQAPPRPSARRRARPERDARGPGDSRPPRVRRPPFPSGFAHQSAVADDRTRAIASAMKIHQHAGRVGAGNKRPFTLDPVEIDRLERDITPATGQTAPTSSIRRRRSSHPTGRGLAPSSARTASISVCSTKDPIFKGRDPTRANG